MSVRLTGGRLRGRVLPVPPVKGVRPTSARVREALFSILGQDLRGCSVLDAFAGAGLLGIEAASRGAGPVVLADRDRRVVAHLRRAVIELGLDDVDVRQVAAEQLLASGAVWDLVLLDPPYADDPVRWATLAAPCVGRTLVVEHRQGQAVPAAIDGLQWVGTRRYGDTALSIWQQAEAI
ncbi:MAG: RsmD family RNA methyltransferase [Alphaproteobacteria bacterium]|nr:RsmD family RNA methyltransferase [Alphaproteobacteria bacterium]